MFSNFAKKITGNCFLAVLLQCIFFAAPVIGQSAYDGLRSTSGSPGQVLSLSGPYIEGDFVFSEEEPFGSGDDNGTVISAANHGFWLRRFTYDEDNPIELDWFELKDKQDITRLLRTLASGHARATSASHGELFLRAPSVPKTLYSQYVDWDSLDIRVFSFLESTAPVIIKHLEIATVPVSKYTLWMFKNFKKITIGGDSLLLTFQSNHPGLGTGELENRAGLVDFRLDNAHMGALLVDFRANVRDTFSQGLNFEGSTHINTRPGRVEQVNVAGLFWNSGIRQNSGVRHLWYDPDKLTVSDPYLVKHGWDGSYVTVTPPASSPRLVGCVDKQESLSDTFWRAQPRVRNANAQYVDRVTGGVVIEWGTPHANLFAVKDIGTSLADPFVIRYKDFGASGPDERIDQTVPANYQQGVAPKKKIAVGVIKHDPLPEYGHTKGGFRFIRIVELPPEYGNGVYNHGILQSECDPATETDNTKAGGTPYIWLAEVTGTGVSPYITAYVDVTFEGVKADSWISNEWGPTNFRTAYGPTTYGAQLTVRGPDRSFGHIMRAAEGSQLPFQAQMHDRITLTGPGSWQHVNIVSAKATNASQSEILPARDNLIHDTGIYGQLTIGLDHPRAKNLRLPVSNTNIRNVRFFCDAGGQEQCAGKEVVIIAGANTDVHLQMVSAPPNAKIVGSLLESPESVTLNGVQFALPFVFGESDEDGDGIYAELDNCPEHANPAQIDSDGDGIGDACASD